MEETNSRRFAATDSSTRRWLAPRRGARFAALAALASLAFAASADAGSGGTGVGPGGPEGSEPTATAGCAASELGTRAIGLGDCGEDVRTLNWILKSKDYPGVGLIENFVGSTEEAVRAFQRTAAIKPDGIVERQTHEALVNSMPSQIATYYGPGFYGNTTACGETLTRATVGVAHKTLPCGSKVVVRYGGEYLRTTVIDRGPYANNAKWDLTSAAAEIVGLQGTDEIRVAKLAKTKRK